MLGLGLVLVAGAVTRVVGAPNPTEPSGTSVFNVGKDCAIKWDPDTAGGWKDMSIQLMTGDNFNMVHITTVGQHIDATDATKSTYTYTCPNVTPNSAIYFYQFSDPSNSTDLMWTTRWTLASATGQTTPPTESTQPNGDKIPWGTGALVDPSTAVPPPSYLNTNQSSGSTNSTSGVASSPAATSAAATGVVVATTPSAAAATTPTTTSHATILSSSSSAAARPATTGASTGASASNSTGSSPVTSANGAMATAVSGFAMVGAFAVALVF